MARNLRNQPERWIVECRGAAHLRQQGVTETTLRPGQRVIVTGSPGRVSADHRLRLRAIVRPQDGWRWRDTVN
jgi:thiamine monophosphate kinase